MLEVELLQERYLAQTDREHRRAAGQFFTPRWVARGLARWVMAAGPKSILDPAFGFGILLDECRRQGYTGELIGYENDREIARCWKETGDGAVQLHEMDFLASGHSVIDV